MTDIVYYRKMAEIALRDGADYETRALGARVLDARNPRKTDRKKLKKWMYTWIDQLENRASGD